MKPTVPQPRGAEFGRTRTDKNIPVREKSRLASEEQNSAGAGGRGAKNRPHGNKPRDDESTHTQAAKMQTRQGETKHAEMSNSDARGQDETSTSDSDTSTALSHEDFNEFKQQLIHDHRNDAVWMANFICQEMATWAKTDNGAWHLLSDVSEVFDEQNDHLVSSPL